MLPEFERIVDVTDISTQGSRCQENKEELNALVESSLDILMQSDDCSLREELKRKLAKEREQMNSLADKAVERLLREKLVAGDEGHNM